MIPKGVRFYHTYSIKEFDESPYVFAKNEYLAYTYKIDKLGYVFRSKNILCVKRINSIYSDNICIGELYNEVKKLGLNILEPIIEDLAKRVYNNGGVF